MSPEAEMFAGQTSVGVRGISLARRQALPRVQSKASSVADMPKSYYFSTKSFNQLLACLLLARERLERMCKNHETKTCPAPARPQKADREAQRTEHTRCVCPQCFATCRFQNSSAI